MKIIDNKGAPPELIRVAVHEAEVCNTVNTIIFDAFIKDLNGDKGAFAPETGTLIIDMGACILDTAWMKRGFMVIANAWFNLLMTVYHEMAHAAQLDEEPELMSLDALPEHYEEEATRTAGLAVLNWADEHETVPTLNELGWVGDQLKILLNKLYTEMPEVVDEELNLEGTNMVAYAQEGAESSREYNSAEEIAVLLKQIDDGVIGKKVGEKRYLTAYEAIGIQLNP